MERTYVLELDGYKCFCECWIAGETIRISKVRFFDEHQVRDKDTLRKLRAKYHWLALVRKIRQRYDLKDGIRIGYWTDPQDDKSYDIHQIVELKDGFEQYVLARDLQTWGWVLLDMERVAE